MTFDQLMDHARQIEDLATRWAVRMSKQGLGDQGPPTIDQVYPGSPYYGVDYERFRPQFAMVSTLFAPFAGCPDPAGFRPLIEVVCEALKRLSWGSDAVDPFNGLSYTASGDLTKMAGVSSSLEDWTGLAAQEFKETFIDPFPSIERNQFLLTHVLKSTLEAEWAIWVAARRDIDDIAHKTLAALDHMEDCGRNTWGQSFTVAACLTSIAAAPFTGGISLALNLVGAAAWVAAASPPVPGSTIEFSGESLMLPGPAIEFSGESPQAVIASMREAISRLTQSIQFQRDRIDRCLNDAQSTLAGDSRDFVFPRPALAGASPNTLTGPTGLGYVP
jgi:hypothetical protein